MLQFILGCYFIIMLYHFFIFFDRKKDNSNLAFSLFSVFYIIIIFLNRGDIFNNFKQNYSYFYETARILTISFFGGCIVFLLSTVFDLKKEVKKMIINSIIFFILGIISIGIMFINRSTFGKKIFYLYGIFCVGSNAFLALKEIIRLKQLNSIKKIILTIGLIWVAISSTTMAILNSFSNLNSPFWMNLLAALITMSAFAIATAKGFNKDHRDLINLTNTLEQKVIERTKQLEETNKQKTIAFTNISHEIKTPLTIISNYIEKHIKNHGATEEIKVAKDNLYKLKRDIIDVLDFEKLDSGMAFYDHSQIIDVSEVIRMNILMFKELANRKGINIKYDIQNNIYAKIDPDAIDRIINILIDNAIKYTLKNGEININLKEDKKDIEIIIQDTGIGIPEEEYENIFKPYYQISHKKSNIQGIGMGLNITKKIIDEAGGKIEVESKLNEGTKFTIILKKHIFTKNDIVQKRIENAIPIDYITDIKLREEKYIENKNNIFIVEDNLQMLSYLQENLIEKYNVFYAKDGKEALEKLRNIPKPDIIIADIMMDVMDGYEFYYIIKKSEVFNDIPFLFLTAKSGINEKIKALSKGAVDFITKPFDINELLFKLNSIIEINIKHEKKFIESIYKSSKKQLKEVDEKIEAIDYDKFKEKFNLSNKEIEICKLIKERLTNKEIGQRLNKAESTIKNYIQIIFEKLFVNKREKAIELMDEFKKRKF